MTVGEFAGLHLVSDLHLSVDGVSAEIVADGRRLTLCTDDAVGLATRAAGSRPTGTAGPSLRDVLDRAGALLESAGLSARINGEHGTLLELGAGCRSRSGRLLFGSEHARLGSARALLPLAAGCVRSGVARPGARPIVYALVASALAGVAATSRHRRGPRPGQGAS